MRYLTPVLLAAAASVLNPAMASIEPAISPGENTTVIAGSCTHPLFGGQRFGAGDDPLCVTLCDLNSDGNLDLVVANLISDDLSILLGNGDNTFTVEVRYVTGNEPRSVAAHDLDNDGNIDLAVANGITDDVSILLGNGDGNVGTKDLLDLLGNWGSCPPPPATCFADLDCDGSVGVEDKLILLGNWGLCPGGGSLAAVEEAVQQMGHAGLPAYEAWLSQVPDEAARAAGYVLYALLEGQE